MPTYAWLARFGADFDNLTKDQQAAFLDAVPEFVEDHLAPRGHPRQPPPALTSISDRR